MPCGSHSATDVVLVPWSARLDLTPYCFLMAACMAERAPAWTPKMLGRARLVKWILYLGSEIVRPTQSTSRPGPDSSG